MDNKKNKKIRISVVGLRFGGAFAPIYHAHPDVEYVGICDTNAELLNQYGDKFGFTRRHTDLEEILQSDEYDAVHLVSPIPHHAQQSIAVLNSGKHCACTVPMATTIEDIHGIITAQKQSKKNYMMMETTVYTYQYLFAKEMFEKGEFGRVQFLRGAHYQNMDNWPSYWMGLPPMHYATHAVAPLLAIANARATRFIALVQGLCKRN
ncbi:Gfo/Idh/MocA family oxidoreductase [Paenibacillus sp. WQ 127069]|uniref:Gfo/Idh/MocA family oxidoreductase n=1 Tax=Paenibacillus baimaensis TaxID=2982185 RepID=A0ABT2UDI3_9BACL|nr:Gfo/Idh/MocA family oxidoreductase [Paenibacillus sp. WQ 127069]MCU6792708.1 Gfo/Idh/MocA family oxidoreductase [Paenibacillus sp. WQ 127069]